MPNNRVERAARVVPCASGVTRQDVAHLCPNSQFFSITARKAIPVVTKGQMVFRRVMAWECSSTFA